MTKKSLIKDLVFFGKISDATEKCTLMFELLIKKGTLIGMGKTTHMTMFDSNFSIFLLSLSTPSYMDHQN